jgi:hypothetical protein
MVLTQTQCMKVLFVDIYLGICFVYRGEIFFVHFRAHVLFSKQNKWFSLTKNDLVYYCLGLGLVNT